MTPALIFALPGNQDLAEQLASRLQADYGLLEYRRFPDGESYLRLHTPVQGREVILVCSLNQPDTKSIPLYLAACIARELGARRVGLVLPYLAYMRQDAHFHLGEGITSAHFARLLSSCADWLVTVDPHLHRHATLDAIYTIPSRVVAAAPVIAQWVNQHIPHPLMIGPDAESEQWVQEVAHWCDCPATVLQKVRTGDRAVAVSLPKVGLWSDRTPVLVDDIASTARTMIAAAAQIRAAGLAPPVCIAVHALFAEAAYAELAAAGVERIVTCNTVVHPSNAIDLTPALAVAIQEFVAPSAHA